MKNLSVYCVNDNMIIKDAVLVIQNNLSRCCIVVNNSNKVVGMFSEGDVLRTIMEKMDIHASLKNAMKPSFFYLNSRDLAQASELVKKHGITLIPVIDNEFQLVDIITLFDVLDYLEKK